MNGDDLSDEIESERHVPTVDSNSLNKAVERASGDRNFISKAVEQLDGLKVPAYKHQIIDFLKKKSSNSDLLALIEL